MKHRSLFSVIINLNKIKQERLTPMYKNYTTPTDMFGEDAAKALGVDYIEPNKVIQSPKLFKK